MLRDHKEDFTLFFDELSKIMNANHTLKENEGEQAQIKELYIQKEKVSTPMLVRAPSLIPTIIEPAQDLNNMESQILLKTKEMIKKEIDDVFESYSKSIVEKWKANYSNIGKNEEQSSYQYKRHIDCDEQEMCILNSIENYMVQGKLEMASKLIQWRKNLISIAKNCGWEVAKRLSIITAGSMTITHLDFIRVNIELNKSDHESYKPEIEDTFFDTPKEILLKKNNNVMMRNSEQINKSKFQIQPIFNTNAKKSKFSNMSEENSLELRSLNEYNQYKPEQNQSAMEILLYKADNIKTLSMKMGSYLKLRTSTINIHP